MVFCWRSGGDCLIVLDISNTSHVVFVALFMTSLIETKTIVGWITREAIFTSVVPENSRSLPKIDMVKPVNGWKFDNIAGLGRSYGSAVRRILPQSPMRSPRLVVIQIRRQKSLQMPFVENDDVVEQFSAQCADHPLHISILPW